jgi:hypothetical protein
MRTALVEGCIVPTENTALEARLETLRAAGHHDEGVSITTGKYLGNTKPDELQRGPPRQGSAEMTFSNGSEGPKSIAPHQGLRDFEKCLLRSGEYSKLCICAKAERAVVACWSWQRMRLTTMNRKTWNRRSILKMNSCQQIVIEQCIV